ncbi:chemotaxis protein MotB [Devosia enhydra]|uniref:Chemotaxis protein MotB n=1 Tax=Devosia enhydra TaxID=665118 RepID=A0A1K2I2U8_9HYPH|nr:flagellar motor protein MotB [Devosia enhydra]SFZ86648.1 chemotaxis protein MotB [Devosia enhydra]
MARKSLGPSEVPAWLVTFADLMSILVCFFVLIISFSIPDDETLQVVAGSMKDAFGLTQVRSPAGVFEREGNPERDFLRRTSADPNQQDSQFATEEQDRTSPQQGAEIQSNRVAPNTVEDDQRFALAAASIRQAWAENPDLAQAAPNLIVRQTEEGLDIVIADQQGRPMFPEGSKFPYEATRKAIAAIAPILARLPNAIRISGHVATGGAYASDRYGPWELSSDRANAVRQMLGEFGLPLSRISAVAGRADTDPFFPNDPYLAANQRVSILVMFDKPPVPAGLSP